MPDHAVITSGHVSRGRLKVRNSQRVAHELQRWRDAEVTITIEKKHATRSLQANRYYWYALGLLSDHTGYHPDELHEHFRAMFLTKPIELVDKQTGEVISEGKVGQSTAKLNTVDFYEYVERVRQLGAELGVVIPDPDPDWNWKGDAA